MIASWQANLPEDFVGAIAKPNSPNHGRKKVFTLFIAHMMLVCQVTSLYRNFQ